MLTTKNTFSAKVFQTFSHHFHHFDLLNHYCRVRGSNDRIRNGHAVIFNASRTVVPFVYAHYSNVHVILIDAPKDVRAARIAARGRETHEQTEARLSRAVRGFDDSSADFVIQNIGTVETGVTRFVSILNEIQMTNRTHLSGTDTAL